MNHVDCTPFDLCLGPFRQSCRLFHAARGWYLLGDVVMVGHPRKRTFRIACASEAWLANVRNEADYCIIGAGSEGCKSAGETLQGTVMSKFS